MRHVVPAIGEGVLPAGFFLEITARAGLVIFAERETEIQSDPCDTPQHFTRDTFFQELEDMGMDSGPEVEQKLEAMLAAGFIEKDSRARLAALDPTMALARSLEKAFPGMPGMNLVAYLVQTLDEALSGRKDPGVAVRQLEQTLEAQKQRAGRPKTHPEESKRPMSGGYSAEDLKSALSATLKKRRQQARKGVSCTKVADQPRIVTASGTVKAAQIQEVFAKRLPVDEPADRGKPEPSGTPRPAEEQKTVAHPEAPVPVDTPVADRDREQVSHDQDHAAGSEAPSPEKHETSHEQGGPGPAVSTPLEVEPAESVLPEVSQQEAPSVSHPSESTAGQPEAREEGAKEEKASVQTSETLSKTADQPSDEALEARISAFEQDLAMKCPVCGNGRIEQKQTAKKKIFYVCTNPECVFVSWGKPYHMACPWCNNPFLIEATKAEKTFLRCPRATCRYQQALSKDGDPIPERPEPAIAQPVHRPRKKRRVVRRRVVRKRR
ncbi:MAG: topoisomerase DNA-binding C4 zinc finger domain-containing protein [Deltaproteobacteria bacterium]|nr:topoisomerase DNA-binding C4 zinc finger domain-containing protein [Deltaproteobacteria bacterium]